ncbi:MAG TPA: preprotein translocase subunit SecG [Polyangia bacterium]|nr:preprotein translocase subunit SecG [Polyangia bacterium]
MITFLTILHVLICVFLILVVLLQAGKGGGMGIAFGGGGGSQTVFGSSGAGNFLTRLTSITAFLFLLTSLALAHFSSQQDSRRLQRLAEQKAAQKKDEDARSAKLKLDLDKARDNIQKTAGGTAPGATSEPATSEPAATAPAAKTETKAGETKAGATKAGAKAVTKPAATKPAAKPHKKAAAPPEGESAPEDKPSVKQPEAPAAPAE